MRRIPPHFYKKASHLTRTHLQRARLLGQACETPEHRLDQSKVVDEAGRLFGSGANFARLRPVFANTGIETRWSARPLDWFRQPQDWPSRTEAYLDAAPKLFAQAARAALEDSGLTAGDVDTVVTVSTTGIATPSLEARAMTELGLSETVRRVPVFGLGCAGGVTGLSLAARLAEADPGSTVLLVAVELCTLAFRHDSTEKSNIVATALFGDGAAAAVLSTKGEGRLEITATGERTWPDTLDVMGWSVDPAGLGAIFSRSIPDLVGDKFRAAADSFLKGEDLTAANLDHFVFHPGGAKVIEALEGAFDLPDGALAPERETLRQYGNMSAPTALFVLRAALDEGRTGRGFLAALGPGFTASMMVFES